MKTGTPVARGVQLDVAAAVDPPRKGEAKQLQRILDPIATGHAFVLASAHLDALEKFQDAVRRATKLIP